MILIQRDVFFGKSGFIKNKVTGGYQGQTASVVERVLKYNGFLVRTPHAGRNHPVILIDMCTTISEPTVSRLTQSYGKKYSDFSELSLVDKIHMT